MKSHGLSTSRAFLRARRGAHHADGADPRHGHGVRSSTLVRLHPHSLVTSHTLAPAAGWFAIAKGSGPHELA